MTLASETLTRETTGLRRPSGDSLAPVYKPLTDHVFVDGDGAYLWDDAGRRMLDMTSGIGVLALGHRSQVVRRALRQAADGLIHTSNLIRTEPALQLAQTLTGRSFADRVFFANSGTEANEGAIKFARAATPSERQTIVYFDHSFHGRTFGSLAATDRLNATDTFGPMPGGFRRAEWNDRAAFDAIDTKTAAVLVEPVQGEGGVRPASREWMSGLRAQCDEAGALLIFDEVQCGVGRTGRLWAHEHLGVTPDLMTLAKPLAGGLPIGAILMIERVAESLAFGCHGSTFGGGPAVTHVARCVLEKIAAPEFLAGVRRKGATLARMLESIDVAEIEEVRGLGLMVGVQISLDAKRVLAAAVEEDLLVTSAGPDVIRFLPPLNCGEAELTKAVRRFERALKSVATSSD